MARRAHRPRSPSWPRSTASRIAHDMLVYAPGEQTRASRRERTDRLRDTPTSRRVPWRRPAPARTSPTLAVTPPSRLLSPLVQRLETLGAPGRIRTCDLRLRRPSLYPTELRAQSLRLETNDAKRAEAVNVAGLRKPDGPLSSSREGPLVARSFAADKCVALRPANERRIDTFERRPTFGRRCVRAPPGGKVEEAAPHR